MLAYGFGSVKVSPDNGQTWGPRIAGAQGDANGHPYNMELTYLGNGTLLLPWNHRSYGADGVPFSIRVNASTDGGQTWTQRAIVHEAADQVDNGVWEPAIIQLPNGDL